MNVQATLSIIICYILMGKNFQKFKTSKFQYQSSISKVTGNGPGWSRLQSLTQVRDDWVAAHTLSYLHFTQYIYKNVETHTRQIPLKLTLKEDTFRVQHTQTPTLLLLLLVLLLYQLQQEALFFMQFIASFSCNSLPTGLGCGNMYVTDLLAGCPQGPQLTWTAMSMHNEHTHTHTIYG